MPKRPQNCPYQPQEKKYGKADQDPIPIDTLSGLEENEVKVIQRVIGSILWYIRSVDMTVLIALSTIANQQSKDTKNTWNTMKQLLDYLALHPDTTFQYRASDMVLNIFQCLISVRAQCTKSRMWTFLPWMDASGW